MRKLFKKIICVAAAAVMGASLFATAACSSVYKSEKLDGEIVGDTVVSNGGFAVQKGNYVYYINGKQTYTADNTYGKVKTGAIMRISEDDLDKRNYANAQTVVPEIAYSGNNDAGIFIYGDRVYYSTPSTEKSSDGGIQNSNILFKSAKIDGSEVMKGYYAKYSDNSIEYRFVVENDVVYLLYLATNEDLYGTSCKNLHSVNTETGEDTLLVYNVGDVLFDSQDLTNCRVYYTMSVKDFTYGTSYSNYNQVYTVTAAATTPNEYDFSGVKDYDASKDPLYINCGTLVLDGIGWVDGNLGVTQFNAQEVQDAKKDDDAATLAKLTSAPYTYSLSNYQNGTLFYSRAITLPSTNTTNGLFKVSESDLLAEGHKPALGNPKDDEYLVKDSSKAANYTYIFEGETLNGAFIPNSNGLIKASVVSTETGKAGEEKTVDRLITDPDNTNTFYLAYTGTPTVLFTEGDYVYFHETGKGSSGYIINSLYYKGGYDQYNRMPEDEGVKEYQAVRILDLDCTSDWYKPEMFSGRIFFSSENKNMTSYSSGTASYSHIMICDISSGGSAMTNTQLVELNKKYESISTKIEEVDEEDYENLKNAYYYAFYTGDKTYIDTVIKAYVDKGEDEEKFWSKESLEKFRDFVDTKNDWEKYEDETGTEIVNYAEEKVTVNGKEVHANQRDYYYALLGKMTDNDAKAYESYVRNTYLKPLPEEEPGWYESLSKGAKAGFIIGIILGVLLIAAVVVVVILVVLNKRKSKLPAYVKKRIKVDTTDDKSVDVYSTEDGEGNAENSDDGSSNNE